MPSDPPEVVSFHLDLSQLVPEGLADGFMVGDWKILITAYLFPEPYQSIDGMLDAGFKPDHNFGPEQHFWINDGDGDLAVILCGDIDHAIALDRIMKASGGKKLEAVDALGRSEINPAEFLAAMVRGAHSTQTSKGITGIAAGKTAVAFFSNREKGVITTLDTTQHSLKEMSVRVSG
jgi:hypothetical protein